MYNCPSRRPESSMRLLRLIVVVLFGLTAVVILTGSLALPSVRANRLLSYAPLREAILPPARPIVLSLLYSTEKEAWLESVLQQMQADGVSIDGRPLQVTLDKMGSREMILAVLNGSVQPDLISPASSLQLAILESLSTSRYGVPMVNRSDPSLCRPVLRTPLVIAYWKERGGALWGTAPGPRLWTSLHDALVDPKGWAAYGHPEWGFVKYGQTDPLKSNSGFMAILLMTYDYFGKTRGLTAQDLLGDAGYQSWFSEFQSYAVAPFAYSTGPLMQDMITIGPSRYDFVAAYEATSIEQVANAAGRYGELGVLYPLTTVVSDHPFCMLRPTTATPWITPEKERAARVLLDYLTAEPAQRLGLLEHGFRPVNASVALDAPGNPFDRLAGSGFRPDLPSEVEVPQGEVLNTLLDLWSRSVRP